MLGDGDVLLDRPAPHSGQPVPAAPPPRGPVDSFFGRVLVQGVGLLGVAAIVFSVVDDRAATTEARLDALETELDEVRRQRDRMSRLTATLTEELDEASIEAEIVRWQLAYTEERAARLQLAVDEAGLAPPATAPTETERAATRVPGPSATFVHLDVEAGATPRPAVSLDPAVAVVAMSMGESATDTTGDFLPALATSASGASSPMRMLELDRFDSSGAPARLRTAGSQLDRDRAFAVWDAIVDEAASGECARRSSAAERRCRDRVRRHLMPWGSRAVECMLSGNAAADYVSDLRLDQLPTHSVPLDEGAVILCDGGLSNLRGGLSSSVP